MEVNRMVAPGWTVRQAPIFIRHGAVRGVLFNDTDSDQRTSIITDHP